MTRNCLARTSTGRPCRRPTGTVNGTETLCGLHALARRRFYSTANMRQDHQFIPWLGYQSERAA